MPEGPSIVILREALEQFKKRKLLEVCGNTKVPVSDLEGRVVTDIRSWGKQLLICFRGSFLSIHLMMFGSYRINEEREGVQPRLHLRFANGEVNFYTCVVKRLEGEPERLYDWEVDVMAEEWNPLKAEALVKALPGEQLCDLLLDQTVFSGSGNIVKNEVLFRLSMHPQLKAGQLKPAQRKKLVKEVAVYCQDFYRWKKAFEFRKHWQIYKKKTCPRCGTAVVQEHMGKGKRLTFFCPYCQPLTFQ